MLHLADSCYICRVNELLFAVPLGVAALFAFLTMRSEMR